MSYEEGGRIKDVSTTVCDGEVVNVGLLGKQTIFGVLVEIVVDS